MFTKHSKAGFHKTYHIVSEYGFISVMIPGTSNLAVFVNLRFGRIMCRLKWPGESLWKIRPAGLQWIKGIISRGYQPELCLQAGVFVRSGMGAKAA
jgi:hypothetical protein